MRQLLKNFFHLQKTEAEAKGYFWRERKERNYEIDIKNENIPDATKDIDETIINKTIECANNSDVSVGAPTNTSGCTKAYKITKTEFEFYKKMSIPIPRLCYNCRYCERIAKRSPVKLWKRKCDCAGHMSSNKVYKNTRIHSHDKSPCENEFETPYSPERPEIVYCEKCYQQEVY
ncbi:MAG: hypothetical protein WCG28_03985 [bacterium]